MTGPNPSTLLTVRNLRVGLRTPAGTVCAVNDVSFSVDPGETVALVGESGCGKTMTALSILRLVPAPAARIVGGSILFEGRDLLSLSEREMRQVRGRQAAMVFQDPMSSLNPVLTIGTQLSEGLRFHLGYTRKQADDRAIELLQMVGIPDAGSRIKQYPHQFSGGMRQRVMIALALSCSPKLIVADEPTTALDVTIQADVLELMKDLTVRLGVSLILITHNLGIVAHYADRINVMYAGRLVETGMAKAIFSRPRHPYTKGLLNSVPRIDRDRKKPLIPIVGQPPDLAEPAPGCAYQPRCKWAVERCAASTPPLRQITEGHCSACFLAEDLDRPGQPVRS